MSTTTVSAGRTSPVRPVVPPPIDETEKALRGVIAREVAAMSRAERLREREQLLQRPDLDPQVRALLEWRDPDTGALKEAAFNIGLVLHRVPERRSAYERELGRQAAEAARLRRRLARPDTVTARLEPASAIGQVVTPASKTTFDTGRLRRSQALEARRRALVQRARDGHVQLQLNKLVAEFGPGALTLLSVTFTSMVPRAMNELEDLLDQAEEALKSLLASQKKGGKPKARSDAGTGFNQLATASESAAVVPKVERKRRRAELLARLVETATSFAPETVVEGLRPQLASVQAAIAGGAGSNRTNAEIWRTIETFAELAAAQSENKQRQLLNMLSCLK